MTAKISIHFIDEFSLRGTASGEHDKGTSPLFISGDGIDGYINLSACLTDGFSFVKIVLEGDLLNSIKPGGQSSTHTYCVQMRQNVLELVEAKTSESFSQPGEHENGLNARFHFDIPNEILTPEGGDANHSSTAQIQSLPASLYIPFPDPVSKLAQCNVSYRVRAQAISSGSVLAETSRNIRIFPTLGHQPPLCTTDFPGEYTLSASKLIRSRFGLQQLGHLFIEVAEPQAFEFRRLGKKPSTAIPLRLHFRPAHDNTERDQPERTHCVVTSRLRVTSFASVSPQQRLPTAQEAQTSSFLVKSSRDCWENQCTLRFPPWERTVHGTAASDGKEGVNEGRGWMTLATLTMEYGDDDYPVPTFASSLVSQRYSIGMSIEIQGRIHAKFDLDIPIQVVYNTMQQDFSN